MYQWNVRRRKGEFIPRNGSNLTLKRNMSNGVGTIPTEAFVDISRTSCVFTLIYMWPTGTFGAETTSPTLTAMWCLPVIFENTFRTRKMSSLVSIVKEG